MRTPRDRKPLFERLKTGMEEAIRHSKGEIPSRPPSLSSPILRRRCGPMSLFAFGWTTRCRRPSSPAC